MGRSFVVSSAAVSERLKSCSVPACGVADQISLPLRSTSRAVISGSQSGSMISSSNQAKSISAPCGGLARDEKKESSHPLCKVIILGTEAPLFSHEICFTNLGGISGGADLASDSRSRSLFTQGRKARQG